jgi:demethylmenaquinone methyltransferase/2-methoxy-6-polyprenyl-1,4-benzoquinol methylase
MSFFDFVAPIYDKLFHPDPGEFCRQGGFSDAGFILDIGGGTGRIAQTLQDAKRKVIVADLSIKMLLQAKKRGQLLPVVADGAALPFDESCITAVLIVDAYHHFQRRERVIREVARVLIRNGILYIFEPNIKKFTVKIIAVLEIGLGMHSQFYQIHEIEKAVTKVGFNTVEIKEEDSSIRLCFKKNN